MNETINEQRRTKRLWLGLLSLIALAGISAMLSVFVGSRDIPVSATWQALFHFSSTNTEHLIVHHLRLPRAMLACVVGCAMGTAGALMQTLTRNPLADPGLLGVNAGATLAVVCAIAFWGLSDVTDYMWFSIAGAMGAGSLTYLLAGMDKGVNPVKVVLSGMALSVILLAMTTIITVNSQDEAFNQYRHWAVGSLQGRGFDVLYPVALLTLVGLLVSMSLVRELNTFALGQEVSLSLGIHQQSVLWRCAIAITVLCGAATAAVGPLSFVGLTAPHIARFFVGTHHRWLLLYSMLIAAALVSLADVVGKLIVAPDEISVGIMTALLGAPVFVWLVKRWKMVEL